MQAKTVSRRALLQACALGAAADVLQTRLEAATAQPLIRKPIPRTGEKLPVIGLGTIWYRDANYPALRQVVQRLAELGGTVIDTAAAYGESEAVVGRAVQELDLRRRCFLATKFDAGHAPVSVPTEAQRRGPGPGGVEGPPPGILRPIPDGIGGPASFERSLNRLHTDRLDLLQVHNMSDAEVLLPQMIEWKRSGKLRYVGVSAAAANPERLRAVLKAFPLDFVQLDYSLGNRAAESGALQACADHGGRSADQPATRSQWLAEQDAGPPAARLAAGDRRDQLGAVLPQMGRVSSGRNLRDTRHHERSAPRR